MDSLGSDGPIMPPIDALGGLDETYLTKKYARFSKIIQRKVYGFST